MFKKLLSIAALGLLALGVNAQDANKFYIGLTVGGGMASGDVAKSTFTLNTSDKSVSGFAQYGYQTGVKFGYDFHEYFGAEVRSVSIGLVPNTTEFQTQFKKETSGSYATTADATWTSPFYTFNVFGLAPKAYYNVGTVQFYVAPFIGYALKGSRTESLSYRQVPTSSSTPTFNNITTSNSSITYSGALAFGGFLGLRTNVNKLVGFNFELGYLNLGSPSISTEATTTVTSNTGSFTAKATITDRTQSAAFLSGNLGITFSF